jgi:thiol-disulfide isomerase/thioredoxin
MRGYRREFHAAPLHDGHGSLSGCIRNPAETEPRPSGSGFARRSAKLAAAFLFLATAFAQPPEAEQADLRRALAEAGSSQIDFARAIERHLQKYPGTGQRAELERAMVRAASELRDNRRLLLYGERVLSREPENIDLLEKVSRILLTDEDKENNTRALGYAKQMESAIRGLAKPLQGTRGAASKTEERDVLSCKALAYQARAVGNLGKAEEAEKLARAAFDAYPNAEAAREAARWLERQGKTEEAIRWLADAFAIADPGAGDEDREKDRKRLGEWYRKWKGSEVGLGDIVLASWDRTQALLETYRATLKKMDPNVAARSPLQFTISGLSGEKLALASLAGKVVVLDFWATWCGPCRAQQPLYEEVMRRYQGNPNVAFLNINTDEDRSVVKPFLDQNGWKKTIYFEDGLSGLLRVSSIPTTVIIDQRGEVASRMNGFIPERFVDMLSERIDELLKSK